MKRILLYSMVASVIVIVIAGGYLIRLGSVGEPSPKLERAPVTLRLIETGEAVGGHGRNGSRAWLGIPYAAPPVGEMRWKPPIPPRPHSGVLEATAPGNPCPQFNVSVTTVEPGSRSSIRGDEDCLYLNVWSAPNAVSAPVMVWLHGGGNTTGQGEIYDGSLLATRYDVVVVTLNYRLGVLGWFAEPSLRTGEPHADSGNFGNLDILLALDWVQNNIAEFGGDPGNVTLFGESAGGANTLATLASPLATGLVHRAIVQSGSYRPSPLEGTDGQVDGTSWATRYVSDLERRGLLRRWLNGTSLADALRSLSAADLFSVLAPQTFGMFRMPTLFADGHVLRNATAQEAFSNREAHLRVPIILGSNRDEAALFLMNHPDFKSSFLGLFPRIANRSDYRRVVHYASSNVKIHSVDAMADWMSASGNTQVYAYRFEWDEQKSLFGFDASFALGAAHAVEIPFVFGAFDIFAQLSPLFPMDEPQQLLSDSMMSYWAEFARAGNPGRGRWGELPTWTPWRSEGDRLLLLDTQADGGIRMSDLHIDHAKLRRELLADKGFKDLRRFCETFALTLRDTSEFDHEEYVRLSCAAWPPEEAAF